jgi:hypothetical protein
MITTRRSVCIAVAVLALFRIVRQRQQGANTSAAPTQPRTGCAA